MGPDATLEFTQITLTITFDRPTKPLLSRQRTDIAELLAKDVQEMLQRADWGYGSALIGNVQA